MASLKYGKITSVVNTKIYPIVQASMDKNSNAFKKCVEKFIISREKQLYDNGPYDRILFRKEEYDDFWRAIKIEESQIETIMQECFFYGVPYHPVQMKDPFTVVMLMIIKYYIKKGRQKEAEIAAIYLAFSGKFYASVHGTSWKKFPPSEKREVMEFVINYKLSEKFALRKEGSLFGAIRSLTLTWLNTYKNQLLSGDDRDLGDIVQQLRDREKAFLKNIADLYFTAIDDKEYLYYESDNLGENKFRLTDNDSLKADKYTENAMTYITSSTVDYSICKMICDADPNIKTDELKNIMESIIKNNENLAEIRTVINILISNFMANNRTKDIRSIEFLTYSMKAKPNVKDKDIIELRTIIENWLNENSPQYNKRKSRIATANSYFKCVQFYFILTINKVCK